MPKYTKDKRQRRQNAQKMNNFLDSRPNHNANKLKQRIENGLNSSTAKIQITEVVEEIVWEERYQAKELIMAPTPEAGEDEVQDCEELTDPIPIKDLNVGRALCRCCHFDAEAGCTLTSTAAGSKDGHSYADMLRDCFGIEINMEEDSTAICEWCEARLRDAHVFKQQVLTCEARLQAARGRPTLQDEPLAGTATIKEELESDLDDHENDTLGDSDEGPAIAVAIKLKPTDKKPRITYKDYFERISSDEFRCLHCGDKVAASLRVMKSHRDRLHNTRCQICGKTFPSREGSIQHKLEVHEQDDRIKCNACDRKFPSTYRLNRHMKVFHKLGEKQKCKNCDYESYCSMRMKHHQLVHASARNFRCGYCKKTFMRSTNLRLHEKIHRGVKDKVCEVCGQAFVQKASLNYHMTKYHPNVNY